MRGCCPRIFCCRALIIWRCLTIANIEYQINEEINDKQVRLIDEEGGQLGLMTSAEALAVAVEKGYDLVKIAPNAVPPVCKLMDYGKFRFEQAKKDKEAKKNQHVIEIKEIRLSPGIGLNDFNVKLKAGQRFLKDGDRLKVEVRFRGREMAHPELGKELLDKYAEECADIASVDKAAKMEGRRMSMFLSPKSSK